MLLSDQRSKLVALAVQNLLDVLLPCRNCLDTSGGLRIERFYDKGKPELTDGLIKIQNVFGVVENSLWHIEAMLLAELVEMPFIVEAIQHRLVRGWSNPGNKASLQTDCQSGAFAVGWNQHEIRSIRGKTIN